MGRALRSPGGSIENWSSGASDIAGASTGVTSAVAFPGSVLIEKYDGQRTEEVMISTEEKTFLNEKHT